MKGSPEGDWRISLTKVIIAIKRLLVKCYDNKMVKLPSGLFYRGSYMQLTNKKNVANDIIMIVNHAGPCTILC